MFRREFTVDNSLGILMHSGLVNVRPRLSTVIASGSPFMRSRRVLSQDSRARHELPK